MTTAPQPDEAPLPGTTDPSVHLSQLLAAMRPGPNATEITVGEILGRTGRKSFSTTLLMIGVLIVSPLSAVPLLPAAFSIMVLVVAVQAITGRDSLWLPSALMRRSLKADPVNRAIDWLESPARWIERRARKRFAALARQPLSSLSYLAMIAISLSWAPLSLIPFSATFTAVGMSLMAAGLVLRDGVLVFAGYVWTGVLLTGALSLFELY